MSHHFERRTTAFVLRLWTGPIQAEGEAQWRGQIEHVGSGEKAHFQVPVELLEFLMAHLPSAGVEPAAIDTPEGG